MCSIFFFSLSHPTTSLEAFALARMCATAPRSLAHHWGTKKKEDNNGSFKDEKPPFVFAAAAPMRWNCSVREALGTIFHKPLFPRFLPLKGNDKGDVNGESLNGSKERSVLRFIFLGALLSNIVRKKWKLVIALNLAGNPLTNPAYQGISFLPYLWGSCIKLRGDKSLAYTRNSLAHKPNYDPSQVFFFREMRHVFFFCLPFSGDGKRGIKTS